ncbi:PucR family transcriptional regulator [Salinibacterium hongtaonis]|uniref:PucR family transcriptional regulator n=1 Tax=Homoserinimonas hongtaonis TaxID=2079791 RepID=UPI0013047EE4|nr:PucR family transcriptional regulator [Salinibacterium hongtaonis]
MATSARAAVQREMSPSRFDVFGAPTAAAIESISLDMLGVLCAQQGHIPGIRMSEGQVEVVLAAVESGVSIEPVTSGIRLLEAAWRRAAIELVAPHFDGEEGIAMLYAFGERISNAFAAVTDENTRRYHESMSRMREMRMMGQRQMLERIIAGDFATAPHAEEILGFDTGMLHACVMLSARPSHEAAVSPSEFASFRRECEKALSAHRVAFVPQDGTSMWMLVSDGALAVSQLVDELTPIAERTPWVIMSIGIARREQPGIRAAYVSAEAVHASRRQRRDAAPIATFADDGHLAVLMASEELVRWLVEEELGPLLGEGPILHDLRHTLEVLLHNLGNIRVASEELYVHRNTIAYRLDKIEALLGRNPLERPLTTHLALQLAARGGELQG